MMDKCDKYAPVVIPTLCRYEHFVHSLTSLRMNTWAKYTDVYIALDYPKYEQHMEGYHKIVKYLEHETIDEFASLTIIKRKQNYGPGTNFRELLTDEIVGKYDRCILAEDDIEFCPVFLEYMNKALTAYENDDSILAVSGYSYPINWELDIGATAFLQDMTFSTWGTGYWVEKFLATEQELKAGYLVNNFEKSKKNGLIKELIKGRYFDYTNFILSGGDDRLYWGMSDVALGIYLKLKNKCVVTPAKTKTRNMGFDGSGVYCSKISKYSNKHSLEYEYANQPWDNDERFVLKMDTGKHVEKNKKALDRFIFVPTRLKVRCAILGLICKIAGPDGSKFFLKVIKRILKKGRI